MKEETITTTERIDGSYIADEELTLILRALTDGERDFPKSLRREIKKRHISFSDCAADGDKVYYRKRL